MFQLKRHRVCKNDFLTKTLGLLRCLGILRIVGISILANRLVVTIHGNTLGILGVPLVAGVLIRFLALTGEFLLHFIKELPLRVKLFEVYVTIEVYGTLGIGYVTE